MALEPAGEAFSKEAPQIHLKDPKSKLDFQFQLNRTKSAGINPWNPELALEPAGDALSKEAPQIYLKDSKSKLNFEFQFNRIEGAENNPWNP